MLRFCPVHLVRVQSVLYRMLFFPLVFYLKTLKTGLRFQTRSSPPTKRSGGGIVCAVWYTTLLSYEFGQRSVSVL